MSIYDAYCRYLDYCSGLAVRGDAGNGCDASLAGWLGDLSRVGGAVRFADGSVTVGDYTMVFPDDGCKRVAGGCGTQDVGVAASVDVLHDKAVRGTFGGGAGVSADGRERFVEEVKVVNEAVHGKHWLRNKAKKEKRKRIRENWRVIATDGCVSDESSVDVAGVPRVSAQSVAGTVNTVDTRCAEEIEAARTLALRRVAENELAVVKARVQLKSYKDKSKTEALERLDAARMEQRINEAKAKSQASFKKCDESMKSLGSSGSAGEFALKQEVKKARDNAVLMKFVQQQADLMMKYASPEVRDMVSAIPPPVLESEFDVFGDCPADFTEDQRESYYLDLQMRQEENDLLTTSWS